MRMMKCIASVLLVAAATFTFAADDYPARAIRMIMPFAPGGPVDAVARILAQGMGARLGQPVLVENRAGANGIIGSEAVARAAPDGYLLLLAPTAHTINPSMYKKLPYDTIRDFSSVAYIGNSSSMVVVVGNDVPIANVRTLVERAKEGKLSYGSAGIGNLLHLAAEHFNMTTGARLAHVPYKGAGPVVAALYGGEVQVAFLGPVQAVNLVKSGKIRALALTGAKRLAQLPDVPTMAESGYPGYEFDGGIQAAVYAPAKTPRAVILKLNAAVNGVLADAETRERFGAMALDAGGGPPEVLDREVATRIEKYAAIIRAAKIEPE